MSEALARAAQDAGMGLTILPVLYERAGFAQPVLRADQHRFATDAARVLRLRDTIRAWNLPNVDAGVAIHSLPQPAQASCFAQARNRILAILSAICRVGCAPARHCRSAPTVTSRAAGPTNCD